MVFAAIKEGKVYVLLKFLKEGNYGTNTGAEHLLFKNYVEH